MADFFREVDEEVRRDRVIKFWTRFRVPIIGLLLLVVAGTAAWRIYKNWREQAAEAASAKYEAAMELSREGKAAEAESAFAPLAEKGPKGYAALARLRLADETAKRDPEAALEAYDALVSDPAYDRNFQDAARLRGAMLRLDHEDPKEFEQRYAPLAGTPFAYRGSLRELLALAALKRADMEAAGRWLDAIVTDPLAPSNLRGRAGALLGLVQSGKSPKPAEPPPALQP